MPRDINFNAGFNGCSDKMNILRNEVVPRRLDKFEEIASEDVDINSYIYVDKDGENAKIKLGDVITANAVQSDWDQEDDTKYDYIKNKPSMKLEEDLVSLYNIGGIHIGQIFEKGTPILDIMKEMLSVSTPEVFRIGAIDSLSINPLSMEEVEVTTAQLISEGYTRELTLNNQYYAIAIPKSSRIILDKVYQAGYALGIQKLDLDEAWDLYVDANGARTTGTFTFEYRFKFKGQ